MALLGLLSRELDIAPRFWQEAICRNFRENLHRVYAYRKQVLAIFDGLISNEAMRPRLQ